jgi:PAS domain S-box-containing protein
MKDERAPLRLVTPFDAEVASAQKRLENLGRLAGLGTDRRRLLKQVLQELSIALNELQIAAEEMRQQSVTIAETRAQTEDTRRRYHELFDLAPDPYLVTGTKGEIHEANLAAGALLGVRPRYLAGKPLLQFISRADRQKFMTLLERMSGSEEVRGERVIVQPRGGTASTVLLDARAQHDALGQVTGCLWLMHALPAAVRSADRSTRGPPRVAPKAPPRRRPRARRDPDI